jgi:hypothetical protein
MNRPDRSGFNGRGPSNGQPPATTHSGWNGGIRGQPRATTRRQPQQQAPIAAETVAVAASRSRPRRARRPCSTTSPG